MTTDAKRLLSPEGLVLRYVQEHPEATGREISQAVGLTERTVITVLSRLEEAGYLKRWWQGRRKHSKVICSIEDAMHAG